MNSPPNVSGPDPDDSKDTVSDSDEEYSSIAS